MPSLHQLIQKLQNELNNPAISSLNLSTKRHLDLKSVRVKLRFQAVCSDSNEDRLSFHFSNPSIAPQGNPEEFSKNLGTSTDCHELELVWAAHDNLPFHQNGTGDTNHLAVEEAIGVPAMSEEDLLKQFILMFGEPGFDSSARATVFVEVLSQCTDEELVFITQSLDLIAPSGLTDSQKALRHRVLCIIRSGPSAAVQKGSQILRDILLHWTRSQCASFILKHWKTQADWL